MHYPDTVSELCQLVTYINTFAIESCLPDLARATVPLMADFEDLYRELGRKLRQARERKGLSQEKLAGQLGISRASVVNIEAGRQRAPLHLLWQLSEALGTELCLLIPRREEMLPSAQQIALDPDMLKQIREIAHGDAQTIEVLTRFVGKLKSMIEINSPTRKPDEQKKSRRKS